MEASHDYSGTLFSNNATNGDTINNTKYIARFNGGNNSRSNGDGDDDNDERNDTADSESVWNLSESLRSLNSYGYRSKDKLTTEEQRKAMRAVVDGHFRVLVSQLLNGEGLHADEGGHESWLEIVTSLSLQAANVVKPDTIGGMDPGGYVKVKCITSGQPTERLLLIFAIFAKL